MVWQKNYAVQCLDTTESGTGLQKLAFVQEVAQEPVKSEINNGHLEEGEEFALAETEEEATSTD